MPAPKALPWTRAEVAILRELYPRGGISAVGESLPGRTWKAIHQKAFKLGLQCVSVSVAPEPRLQGADLERAIQLREECNWSFARIGAELGYCEASVCNAVLIALCPRKGFTPAQRDHLGVLTPEGIGRLRYALKKGLKGVDIQLRLGISAVIARLHLQPRAPGALVRP